MASVADQIVNGECCAVCGSTFVSRVNGFVYQHGHPAMCVYCLTGDESLSTKEGSLSTPKEIESEAVKLSGYPVMNFRKCYVL